MKSGIKSIILIGVLITVLALAACSSARTPAVASSATSASPVPVSVFRVNNLAVNPAEVNAGVQTLIAAYVTNTGAADDKYSANIRIDNVTKPSLPTFLPAPEVTIPGGANQLLSVTTTITNPGTYKVTWGDASRQLVVNPDDAQKPNNKNTGSSLINVTAPDFNAVDVVTGQAVSLKQFAGSAILLNFVNYGCNPGINDAVSAQLLAVKQLKQQRSDFVPVSVFCGCCSPDVLRQFAKQNNFDWPWILDTDYSIAAKYGNYLKKYGYPTLVFIDKDMVIREYSGAIDISTLTQKIDNLVTN